MGRSAPKDTLNEKIREIAKFHLRRRSKPLPPTLADVPDGVLAKWARTTLNNFALLGELPEDELKTEKFVRSTLDSLDAAPWAHDKFLGYAKLTIVIRRQIIAGGIATLARLNGNHTRRASSHSMRDLRKLLPKCEAIYSAAGMTQRETSKLFAAWITKAGKSLSGDNDLALSGEAVRRDYLRGNTYGKNWSALDPNTGMPINALASGPETVVRDWLHELMIGSKIHKERFVDHAVELRGDLLNRYIPQRIESAVKSFIDEIEGEARN